MSYVEICVLLGDLTQCRSRRQMPRGKKQYIENALYRWIKSLPGSLSISKPSNNWNHLKANANNFNARQLRLPYLVHPIIMSRSMVCYPPKVEICHPSTPTPISPVAIIASSLVAGIFEEFLARNELQYLGPIFTFYLLASELTLVTTCRDSGLRQIAQQDLEVIENSLEGLSRRWKSAIGAHRGLRNVIDRAAHEPITNNNFIGQNKKLMLQLSTKQQILLEDFPRDLYRLWPYVSSSQESDQQNCTISDDLRNNYAPDLESVCEQPQESITDRLVAEIMADLSYLAPASAVLHVAHLAERNSLSHPIPALDELVDGGKSVAETQDRGRLDLMADHDCQYVGIGDWLVSDWGSDMAW